MTFEEFVRSSPRGTKTEVMHGAGITWYSVCAYAKGKPVTSGDIAIRICLFTRGACSVLELLYPDGVPGYAQYLNSKWLKPEKQR